MGVSQEQINEVYSAEVVTQDDENLGSVGHVYLDDTTGDPSWITVKTGWFGTRQSLVPLDGAELTQDGKVRVVPSKDTIKDAPNVEVDAHLSSDDQDELFRYYGEAGVDISRYGESSTPPETGHDMESGAVPQSSPALDRDPGEDRARMRLRRHELEQDPGPQDS